jgi:SAM-dependent methyltransferase
MATMPPRAPTRADILNWDVQTWSAALDEWEPVVRSAPPTLRCLEVGAGPGGPSLWLAEQGHDVVCTNLRQTREHALPLHERFDVDRRVEYRDIDLREGLPYRDEFDVVVFKSVLGGLGDDPAFARSVIAEIHAALKPGGVLLFAENIRGSIVHRAARSLAYRVRGSSWRYPTLAELRGLLDIFDDLRLRTNGVAAVLGPSERIRTALAGLDAAGLVRLTPARWHYMAYGVARRGPRDPIGDE